MCTAPLRGLDDIVRVLLPIFGNKEFPLQTTKNLDFLSWKKAIHIKRNSCPRSVFPLEGSGTELARKLTISKGGRHGFTVHIYDLESGGKELAGSPFSSYGAGHLAIGLRAGSRAIGRNIDTGKAFVPPPHCPQISSIFGALAQACPPMQWAKAPSGEGGGD